MQRRLTFSLPISGLHTREGDYKYAGRPEKRQLMYTYSTTYFRARFISTQSLNQAFVKLPSSKNSGSKAILDRKPGILSLQLLLFFVSPVHKDHNNKSILKLA